MESEKKTLIQWREHCNRIQKLTAISKTENNAQKAARIKHLQNSYPDFCEYYFPHYLTQFDKTTGEPVKTIHNAAFHNSAARKVRDTPNLKAVFMWPRGHAKSTHFDVFIPLWLIFQPKRLINVMVVVSKSEDAANGLLADIQAELEANQRIIADFGPQRTDGDWQDGHFVIQRGVAFFAKGRGQSPRGLRFKEARPDYVVIDDLDDDELCRNERRVHEMTEWVKTALFGALDVGRGRFIMVGNLISKTSVLQEFSDTKDVFLSKIKAIDAQGNPVWKEKWTKKEADEMRIFMGYRNWEKEMMHNPVNEGTIFKREWIKFKRIPPLKRYEQLVVYIDPSFKGTTKNDYKAVRFWGRLGKEFHLIDCYVRQDSVRGMVRWCYNLWEQLPENVAPVWYMEANFMQDTLLDEFEREGIERGHFLPVTPDKRKKPDKIARIEAVSPLWERGLVFYNIDKANDPDMIAGIDQTLGLERGSTIHDDAPDADEGAIWKMQKATRQESFTPRLGSRHSLNKHNSW